MNNHDNTSRISPHVWPDFLSLSAKWMGKVSSVSEPRSPHIHSQNQNAGCRPEIIDSTNDAPVPLHFIAEDNPKRSTSSRLPEIITTSNDAPVHPHYMELDEDESRDIESNNDQRSSARSKKHFNLVPPSNTTLSPTPSTDSATQDVPFYAVEATAVIPDPVYEADVVVLNNERKDEAQNQRKHQLIIVAAIVVLLLCIMSAVIGALTALR